MLMLTLVSCVSRPPPKRSFLPLPPPRCVCPEIVRVCAGFSFGVEGGRVLCGLCGFAGWAPVRPTRNKQTITNNCGNDIRILSVSISHPPKNPQFFQVLHLSFPDFVFGNVVRNDDCKGRAGNRVLSRVYRLQLGNVSLKRF